MDPLNHNNAGGESQEKVSLGRLLKSTREERQIEIDEAFRVTRIRCHTLEALENEQWDELPSQVFVKGFLKTYADFLGLDKEMVLERYEEISTPGGDTSEIVKQVSPRTRRWWIKVMLPLLALVFIAGIVYLNRADISIVTKIFQYLGTQAPLGEEKEIAVPGKRGDQTEADKTEAFARPESVEETDLTEIATVAQKPPEKPPPPRFSLTANVRIRTWIAIYVDDQPVKEYLFHPGDTVTWTAQEGFDILVGNAGGIDFLLNGTEIGTLGAEGKVVRVKLPKGEQ